MANNLDSITDDLVRDLSGLRFGAPVTHVYNPLEYARPAWDLYAAKYGAPPRRILLLGMNPGPFGMAQVGVPFGEVGLVRSFLGIQANIGKPALEHPKRPIQGFACPRSEVSGQRFWGWARDRFGTPERFFAQYFVTNYCPLVFMAESGANLTPDKLPAAERDALFGACDQALRATLALYQPAIALGVGQFAESRLRAVLGSSSPVHVGRVPHPSPASPSANRDWAGHMDRALAAAGATGT